MKLGKEDTAFFTVYREDYRYSLKVQALFIFFFRDGS